MNRMTQRAPAHRGTISGLGAIVWSPKNTTCSLTSERATTHPLERLPLWPVLSCPRMAGFEMFTEAETPADIPTPVGFETHGYVRTRV